MRTNAVNALELDGCAVMSLGQFGYPAWFVEEKKFATLTGTHDWIPFSYTFECKYVEWFELSLETHPESPMATALSRFGGPNARY
jgi:hypothetical protein